MRAENEVTKLERIFYKNTCTLLAHFLSLFSEPGPVAGQADKGLLKRESDPRLRVLCAVGSIEPVKTNSGVPNSNCKHSVPCADQVWLTWAKDQEGVQPAVFSYQSVGKVNVLFVHERPAAPAFRKRSRKQSRGLHRYLSNA